METKVIYHSADFDGKFCREIARRFLPDAKFIGWNYGDPVPQVSIDDRLYILDLSIEELMWNPNLVWIDHHKSAMDKYSSAIPGYRIDGIAACRLAWQWFMLDIAWDHREMHPPYDLPGKEEFVNRTVPEPWAVCLAGEYDVWDKRNPDAELFQHGLRSQDLSSDDWKTLLDWPEEASGKLVVRLLNQGRALQYSRQREDESAIQRCGFDVIWMGMNFLACNWGARGFNSLSFTAGLQDRHDACLGYRWNGKRWEVSLYHAPGKENHDLSAIASLNGGGGHRGACGFTCDKLPFIH